MPQTLPETPTPVTSFDADLVVVGAGIVGLAHAALALNSGLRVIVIDRDHEAVGASVRNFGHACITAQSGELYEMAQVSRRHWLTMASRAGFWLAESGAVVVARTATELAVMEELSATREPGQVVLLDAAETATRIGRPDADGIHGGAWLRDDLRVDPRTTVAKLAAWVAEHERGSVRWNTAALGFEAKNDGGAVTIRTSRGILRARQSVVCVGHDIDYLWPELAAEHQIERCSLQMALAAAPAGLDLAPAVLTATSMLRYPAFTDMPSAARLRDEVLASSPELLDIVANVMCTQRPDGTVIVGDSHAYSLAVAPFLEEDVSRVLIQEQVDLLARELTITQRWQGVYASSAVGPYLVREVEPGVTVVSVTSGVGMTLSFGLAERTLGAFVPALQLSV
ncbi:oxidoreductase [Arthrobacter alpinus]|uniref:Oxidoreductase n=1 Tax=Arthrobacter alpinus TaxID=656366 RepID=A0A0S2M4M7_9MICC|nr:oxidoreductase [Arthrobacter alpinus]